MCCRRYPSYPFQKQVTIVNETAGTISNFEVRVDACGLGGVGALVRRSRLLGPRLHQACPGSCFTVREPPSMSTRPRSESASSAETLQYCTSRLDAPWRHLCDGSTLAGANFQVTATCLDVAVAWHLSLERVRAHSTLAKASVALGISRSRS